MVEVIFAFIIILAIISFSVILHINKLQQQVNLLDKEQHIQNEDIYKLMKENNELKGMILQHVEILKYLIEQDPKLNSGKMYYTGPVGEA
jgi:predicted Holliday junction resolvase-like endonuclease